VLLFPLEEITVFGGHPETEPRLIEEVYINLPDGIRPEQHVEISLFRGFFHRVLFAAMTGASPLPDHPLFWSTRLR